MEIFCPLPIYIYVQMTKHGWDSYMKYAWGFNELRPISKIGHQPDVLGKFPLGATIVDALGTLHIMGLHEDFELARDWVKNKLAFNKVGEPICAVCCHSDLVYSLRRGSMMCVCGGGFRSSQL